MMMTTTRGEINLKTKRKIAGKNKKAGDTSSTERVTKEGRSSCGTLRKMIVNKH
jgi:hypothetical protein